MIHLLVSTFCTYLRNFSSIWFPESIELPFEVLVFPICYFALVYVKYGFLVLIFSFRQCFWPFVTFPRTKLHHFWVSKISFVLKLEGWPSTLSLDPFMVWKLPLKKDGKKSRFLATLNNIYFWHARMICNTLISVSSSFQLNWNFPTPELTIFWEFAAFFQVYGPKDHKQDFQSLSMAPDGL